jgi:hypothetical protein
MWGFGETKTFIHQLVPLFRSHFSAACLVAMVMALASEVSVLRERSETLSMGPGSWALAYGLRSLLATGFDLQNRVDR